MRHHDIGERLTAITRDELEDETIVLAPDAELVDVPGWDSVSMSAVLIRLEDEFGVRFQAAEIDDLSTAGRLVALIEMKLQAPSAAD